MSVEIETLENARYGREDGYAFVEVTVNGRVSRVYREKALRLDGQIAALGYGFDDFAVIVPASDTHGVTKPVRLAGYTNDRRYVALVKAFCDAVDDGVFAEGDVSIPT